MADSADALRLVTWTAVGALRGAARRHRDTLGPAAGQLLELVEKVRAEVRPPGPTVPRLTILATAIGAIARDHDELGPGYELFRAAMRGWGIVLT